MALGSARRMDASLVSTKLLQAFSRGRKRCKVHSQFENATNLEMEDGFIFTLLPEKIPPNPRGIILPEREWAMYRYHPLSVGEEVLVKEKRLEISGSGLNVEFEGAKPWNPLPSLPGRPLRVSKIRRNLDLLEKTLCADTPHGGERKSFQERLRGVFEAIEYNALSENSRNLFRNRISEACEELFFCLANGESVNALKAVDKLIGLGPGLTPSGDDLLTGVMAAGVFFSMVCPAISLQVRSLNSQIAARAFKRTTVFGQMMLSDASGGEVVQPVGELLQTLLCSKEGDSLFRKARQVMAIGESSGKDMLAGVILGMEGFLNLGENREQPASGDLQAQGHSPGGILRCGSGSGRG
jgi:hypothetical protein